MAKTGHCTTTRTTTSVTNPIVSLAGTWKFTTSPSSNFWEDSVDVSTWSDVAVPANLEVQGFDILGPAGGGWLPNQDIEYPYKRKISIPADYSGNKILLRFEGVYNYARVWVNGTYVRDHQGAFTTWDCDITDYVTPGQDAWITVGVTAKTSIEYFLTRGIIGDVKLMALPHDYITRLHVETDMDDTYTDATLKVTGAMTFNNASDAVINLTLKDPQGNSVEINPNTINLSSTNTEDVVSIPVTAPQKWDAEHPNLYTLEANLVVDGSTVETVQRKVGFREIEILDKEMLVNGNKVKLRGINFHQLYALKGVASEPEWDKDVLRKLKEANINYIRTAHMPQYEYVYDLCDELGFYVEGETSVFFIGYGNPATQSLESEKPNYMNTYAEMLEKDKSHPSIVMWSIANESAWGTNMQAERDYSIAEDTTRPTKFSWGFNAPSGTYDIYSVHYALSSGVDNAPALHDEYAHIYTNDYMLFAQNPGVRNYYGKTIKSKWDWIYNTNGALGGAIWHAIDYVNYMPNGTYQDFLSEWGILDSWGREKPEYWHVKKAYSPIVISNEAIDNPGSGVALTIPVENRFDNTNLNEIDIKWSIGQSSGIITDLNVAPRESGSVTIPARNWQMGDVVNIKFCYKSTNKLIENQLINNDLIDEYNITIGKEIVQFPQAAGPAPSITDNGSNITVSGTDFSIEFSKTTGLITSGNYKGTQVITGGPYLNLGLAELSQWSLSSISSSTAGDKAVIDISGYYGTVECIFKLNIDSEGLISTTYTVNNPPAKYNGGMSKGYSEVGVAYNLVSNIDTLKWKRNGLWSSYPDDHIGRLEGTAQKIREGGNEQYRVEPQWAWSQDMKYFAFHNSSDIDENRRSTKDFHSGKADVIYASCIIPGSNIQVRAESDGTGQVRAAVNADGTVRININNDWYAGKVLDALDRPMSISSGYTNTVKMRLTDSDNYTVKYLNDLAFNKTITADSEGTWDTTTYVASNAVDGNDSTRWASDSGNGNHWLQVDLGSTNTIDQVRINWEAAYAVDYKVQVSTDGTNWTDVVNITDNSSEGEKAHTFSDIDARYVRVYTTRARWNANVSLWTLNVYADSAEEPTEPTESNLALNKPVTASTDRDGGRASHAVDGTVLTHWASIDTTVNCDQWLQVDLGASQNISRWVVTHDQVEVYRTRDFTLEYSNDGTNWTVADTVTNNNLEVTDRNLSTAVNARYIRLHITKCCADGQQWPAARIKEFELYREPQVVISDLALNKTVTADSEGTWGVTYVASNAVDGNDSTRWSSDSGSSNHWIKVDLGSNHTINQVKINWEAAYAVDYAIQVSTDDVNWTDVASITNNNSEGLKTHNFTDANARYVRINTTQARWNANVSLWTFNVLGY